MLIQELTVSSIVAAMMMVSSRMALTQSPRPYPLRVPARRYLCCAGGHWGRARVFFAHCEERAKIQTILGRVVRCKDEVSKILTRCPRIFPCYEDEASNRHTMWVLTPNLAACILPFCLALLLAELRPGFAIAQDEAFSPSQYKPLSEREIEVRSSFTSRIDRAISCLERGKEAQAQGDFSRALLWYTQAILIYICYARSIFCYCVWKHIFVTICMACMYGVICIYELCY